MLITYRDPAGLARAVEQELGVALPWRRLDEPGFEDATAWLCAGAPPESALHLPRLRWIHSGWAGVDAWFRRPEWSDSVALTRTVGDFPQRIAQHVFGYLLARALGVDRALRQMAKRSWDRWSPESIAGRRLLIVGMGAIGNEVAAVGRALGMDVVGIRRRAPHRSASKTPPSRRGVPRIAGVEELAAFLPWADVVVNLLPLTPETESFWNADRFAALGPGVVFVNVSRGATVDEGALIRGLREERPAAAILDVFREEPLPPEHPLRAETQAWITPHVAGISTIPEMAREFAANWRRFRAGEPLHNRVDRARGY